MVNWCLLVALVLCLLKIHSSPNCETSKWIVSGETRWYKGANVNCLCGATNCSLFLGAMSRRFRYNHVLEYGDDRYIVDELPVYDSTDFESTLVISGTGEGNENAEILNDGEGSMFKLEPTDRVTKKMSQHKPKLKCEQCPDAVREEMKKYVDVKKKQNCQALLQANVTNTGDDKDEDREKGEATE
uniref:Post-SET domain-containing protein n=1 Tax=Solanum lycopersicum TaxID=4081 RepID=K4CCK6_SOLLC